jgi:cell division protein FtsZ
MNAKGVLINITGGADVTLRETEVITDVVNQIVDLEEGEVFFGTVFDPDARDEIRVTVIATGLTRNASDATEAKRRTHVNSAAQAHLQQAQHHAVDEDDIPAINKQRQEEGAPVTAPSSNGRSTPMSIQDYLKNQQRK